MKCWMMMMTSGLGDRDCWRGDAVSPSCCSLERTQCLHVPTETVQNKCLTIKRKALYLSETSVSTHKMTKRQRPSRLDLRSTQFNSLLLSGSARSIHHMTTSFSLQRYFYVCATQKLSTATFGHP
jgi:hypothetical protein